MKLKKNIFGCQRKKNTRLQAPGGVCVSEIIIFTPIKAKFHSIKFEKKRLKRHFDLRFFILCLSVK